MKAVGNNPLERYVGPETGARHHPTSGTTTHNKINPTAPPPGRPPTPKITQTQDLTSPS